MERPSSFRTSHTGFFTPYRYGEKKYEDYILDTQTHIYEGARAQVAAIESLGHRADEQAQQLQGFIARAGDAWERVSGQMDDLTDQLASGFSTLSHQIKYNGVLLEKVVGQLGLIARSINNPLATQANELVRSGKHLMERGLYREAFEDLRSAEGKRPVNPLMHLFLAQLHYCVKDDGVPFDLSAAERHVNLAIRYATSLRGDLGEDGAADVDLVYGTAAHLALVKGGDLCKLAGHEAGNSELRRADELLFRIDQPSPSSQFLHAQVLALLGRLDESNTKIRALADFTRSWIPRALSEPNLCSVAGRVAGLIEDLKANPGAHSQSAYSAMSAGREFSTNSEKIAVEFLVPNRELTKKINEIEHRFEAGTIDAAAAVSEVQKACEPLKNKITAWIELTQADRARIDREVKVIEEKIKTTRDEIASCWIVAGLAMAGEGAIFLIAQGCAGASNSAMHSGGFGDILKGLFGSLGAIIFGLAFYVGMIVVPIVVLYQIVMMIKRKASIAKSEGQIRNLQAGRPRA